MQKIVFFYLSDLETWHKIWSDFKGHPSNPRDLSIHPHHTWVGQGPASALVVSLEGQGAYWLLVLCCFFWSEIVDDGQNPAPPGMVKTL